MHFLHKEKTLAHFHLSLKEQKANKQTKNLLRIFTSIYFFLKSAVKKPFSTF